MPTLRILLCLIFCFSLAACIGDESAMIEQMVEEGVMEPETPEEPMEPEEPPVENEEDDPVVQEPSSPPPSGGGGTRRS